MSPARWAIICIPKLRRAAARARFKSRVSPHFTSPYFTSRHLIPLQFRSHIAHVPFFHHPRRRALWSKRSARIDLPVQHSDTRVDCRACCYMKIRMLMTPFSKKFIIHTDDILTTSTFSPDLSRVQNLCHTYHRKNTRA